ncbi:MAG: hypothetical protein ACOCP8_10430, partial [archaeon]
FIVLNSDMPGYYIAKYDKNKKIKNVFYLKENQLFDFIKLNSKNLFILDTENKNVLDLSNFNNIIFKSKLSLDKITNFKIKNGEYVHDISKIQPMYIRRSQAQENLQKTVHNNLKFVSIESSKQRKNIIIDKLFDVTKLEIQSLEKIINKKNLNFIVSKYKDENLGYIFFDKQTNNNQLNIYSLKVKQNWKDVNINKLLLAHAINISSLNEKSSVIIYGNENTLQNYNFYKNLGFIQNGDFLKIKFKNLNLLEDIN